MSMTRERVPHDEFRVALSSFYVSFVALVPASASSTIIVVVWDSVVLELLG